LIWKKTFFFSCFTTVSPLIAVSATSSTTENQGMFVFANTCDLFFFGVCRFQSPKTHKPPNFRWLPHQHHEPKPRCFLGSVGFGRFCVRFRFFPTPKKDQPHPPILQTPPGFITGVLIGAPFKTFGCYFCRFFFSVLVGFPPPRSGVTPSFDYPCRSAELRSCVPFVRTVFLVPNLGSPPIVPFSTVEFGTFKPQLSPILCFGVITRWYCRFLFICKPLLP